MTPTLPPSSVTKVCSTPTPGSFTRRTSTMHPFYRRAPDRAGAGPVRGSALGVRSDDDLDALELLEVGATGRGHRAPQGTDQVHPAVRVRRGPEQQLLQGSDGADLHPAAAGQLRV